MTKREFTQLAIQKFINLSTEDLLKLAREFSDDQLYSDTAECKFNAVLRILSRRMTMDELFKFCDTLN